MNSIEASNEIGSGFTHESVALLYHFFQKIDIRRGESYKMSSDWIVSKKATINPIKKWKGSDRHNNTIKH